MNFINTQHWGFDTDLPMVKCIPNLDLMSEDELLDRIFDGDLRLAKLHWVNSNLNKDLLKEFEWRCNDNYEWLQDDYKMYLTEECGYASTEWVTDWYDNFCLGHYKDVVPVYKIPLLANDWS